MAKLLLLAASGVLLLAAGCGSSEAPPDPSKIVNEKDLPFAPDQGSATGAGAAQGTPEVQSTAPPPTGM